MLMTASHPILVKCLCQLYGGVFHYSLTKLTVPGLLSFKPEAEYLPDESRVVTDTWHFGRVRFFYDAILAGKVLDPITIDNVCDRGRIYPQPIVLDGHHRLAASFMATARTIPAWYGGRVDLLNYLMGRRETCPSD
jgi:hypothetical protein